MGKQKNDMAYIKRTITELGYLFTENIDKEYINNKSHLTLICSNNHIRNISFNNVTRYKDCPACKKTRTKYSYDEVKRVFEENGCILMSEIYKDNKSKLEYICCCGNISAINLHDFLGGHRCKRCTGVEKYTIEEVYLIFSKEHCVLLEEKYQDNKTKMKYRCSCGGESIITLSNFMRGARCLSCYKKNNRKENHPSWNPLLTDQERENKRKFNEYSKWRINVFERDKYRCQICGDDTGGNLNAHHLDGYNWCIEKRIDVDNGITLCDICHDDFHSFYGYGDNTKEQYLEWKENLGIITISS